MNLDENKIKQNIYINRLINFIKLRLAIPECTDCRLLVFRRKSRAVRHKHITKNNNLKVKPERRNKKNRTGVARGNLAIFFRMSGDACAVCMCM